MGKRYSGVSYALFVGIFLATFAFAAKENDDDDGGADINRRPLCRNVFEQMSEAYQQTLLDIAEDRIGDARARIAAGDFTEEQKLLLWRLMSGRGGTVAIEALSDFKFSKETLEEITAEIALKDPEASLQLVPELRVTPDELFALLRILAAKVDLRPVAQKFGELNEDQRTELAVLQIRNIGEEKYIRAQGNFMLGSPEAITRVAEALLEGETYTLDHIAGYADSVAHFTADQRFRIARAFAKSTHVLNEWGNFQHFQALGVRDLPEKKRAEIAGLAYAKFVNANGWRAEYFNYLLKANAPNLCFALEPGSVTDVLLTTLHQVDRKWLRQRAERDALLFAVYNGRIMSLGAALPQLKKEIFARDGIATIAEHYNLETLDGLHLVDEAANLDLTRALLTFAEQNPDLLPKDFVTILWDPVRNQSVVLRMLKEFLGQTQGKWEKLPESSLEVLTQVTGLKFEDVEKSKLQRNPGEFYELVMDIQDGLAKPAFRTLPIEPEVFNKRQEFLRLLRALRDLHEQNGDGTKAWKATWKTVGLSATRGITMENLGPLYERTQEALVAAIKEKLAGQNINFTYDQFRRLEEQWGDLEPIWTLLSRYQGNGNWQQEIPALAQVFQASLQGDFHGKKFHGGFTLPNRTTASDVAMAQAQMANILSPEQVAAWIKPRWKVTVPDAREAVEQAAQEARALEGFRDSLQAAVEAPLMASLGEESLLPARVAQAFLHEKVQPLLAEKLLNEDPIPLVDQLIADLRETEGAENLEARAAAREVLRLGIAVMMAPDSSPQEMRGSLRLVRALVTSHREMELGELPETIKAGIGQADRGIKELGAQATGEFILTVLNADPKFLLTIGNAVETGSCQSYSSGGHIETLLGYVMDANVQAVVSFALKQQHFKSASEFNQVVKAQAEGRLSDVTFDGNLKKATFTVRRPEAAAGEAPLAIESLPLGAAYQRQMVKLGHAGQLGTPGVRLERLYQQQHAQANAMQTNHQAILSDILQEMGVADNRYQIQIPPSRNPGGVYSDLGGGIKANAAYVIP